MIYELRTHTIRPGSERIVVDAANSLVEIRGDKFGKLEGYWTSATGHLNQVVLLWSYSDRNERQRLRDELAKDERWNDEFLPMVLDHISRYEIRLLETIAPFNPPATDGNIYTLRTFQTLAGQVGKWIKLFQGILPVRKNTRRMLVRGQQTPASRMRHALCTRIRRLTHSLSAMIKWQLILIGTGTWKNRRSCC